MSIWWILKFILNFFWDDDFKYNIIIMLSWVIVISGSTSWWWLQIYQHELNSNIVCGQIMFQYLHVSNMFLERDTFAALILSRTQTAIKRSLSLSQQIS